MKFRRNIWVALFCAISLLTSIPFAAQAKTSTITIFEPTHRELNGKFIDDDLAKQLLVDGTLGKLIYDAPSGRRVWNIDAALIESIIAMSKGYEITTGETPTGQTAAELWLTQLNAITSGDVVYALPYGNPSGYWIHRLTPHDENYFLAAGKNRLEKILGRPVKAMTNYPLNRYFSLDSLARESFTSGVRDIQTIAPLLTSDGLDEIKLRSAGFLTDSLDSARRDYLARNLTATMYGLTHSVRVVPGKFTVTSSRQSIPVTVINDMAHSVKVQLEISAVNSKVVVNDLPQISLAANSKTQVMIPIEVLTSGTSELTIRTLTMRGDRFGDPVLFPLTLSVISPVATWITTGAAILLFFAVIVQSIRRIRRRSK